MILVLDNYDSFTWNLVALLRQHSLDVEVKRNDQCSLREIEALRPAGILISPGPGRPENSGICPQIVRRFAGHIPILGICLGHQLIGGIFGAEVVHSGQPVHGKTALIHHDQSRLFEGISNPFRAMRYHSLILDGISPATGLSLSAWTSSGEVMGVKHKKFNLAGLQFHPESILTEAGDRIMNNWVHSLSE